MKHGANIYKYASQLKCKPKEIADFSSNINSYQPDVNIKVTNSMLVKYASTSYEKLHNAIKQRYNLKKSQIKLYNGASSAIFALLNHLKEKKVYLYAPLYGEYEEASKESRKKIIKIDRRKNLFQKPKKSSIVIFVNPSTPDGKYYDLKKLFKIWREQKSVVILDESFLEFESLKSFRDEILSYEKLYIIQSFSKFYSCAGVRIGAIFSNKENISNLKTPLWNISSFDAKFLEKRILDKKFNLKSKKKHLKNKKKLYKILKKSGLFDKIYKTDSNFIMTKSNNANELFKHLLKDKILVRKCESFDFLDERYIRFGVKEKKLHKRLQRSFAKILQ